MVHHSGERMIHDEYLVYTLCRIAFAMLLLFGVGNDQQRLFIGNV